VIVVAGRPRRRRQKRVSAVLGRCQGTLGALAPCSGFLPSRPARRPSAVHDAWRVTRLNPVHQAPRGTFGENSPHLLGNIEKGKSEKKSLGEAPSTRSGSS
jgi:hypothetical protein